MNTLRLQYKKTDIEKWMITLGMAIMEIMGFVLLFCGLFEIRPFKEILNIEGNPWEILHFD